MSGKQVVKRLAYVALVVWLLLIVMVGLSLFVLLLIYLWHNFKDWQQCLSTILWAIGGSLAGGKNIIFLFK